MFGFDPLYFALTLPGLALALWAQYRVQSAFSKYSRVGTTAGLSGAEVADRILRVEGIRGVGIEPSNGFLSDHYDPLSRTLRLSPDVYHGRSVAAVGIAAHEVGHAVQHGRGYLPLQVRSALVPGLQVTSHLAFPLILVGGLLQGLGAGALGWLAIYGGLALFALMVVFQLVTLPVEFDASRRALAAISRGGLLTGAEIPGARAVLSAAALTYVAAAVSSALQLLYFLIRTGVLGGRREE